MKNKKGVLIFEIGIWVMRVIMVIIILGGVALQIRALVNARVNMDVVEPALLIEILGNSPAILLRDASGTYQHKIDVEKFRNAEQELNRAFEFAKKERHAAARIELIEWEGVEPLKEIKLNPELYDEIAFQPRKAVAKTTRKWPVMLVENERERRGILRVEVVQPR